MRRILVLLCGILPASNLKNWLLRRTGWQVGRNVHIGPGLFLGIERVELGDRY